MKIVVSWILYSVLFLFSKSLYSREISQPQRSICVILREDFCGEREFGERIKIACENLKWKVKICSQMPPKEACVDFDWMLTLTPEKPHCLLPNHYLVMFDPEWHYFNPDGHLSENFLDFAGYLATYEKTETLLEDMQNKKKRLYPKRWYPTVYSRPYQQVMPTRLFYFIGRWGNRVATKRHQTLQNELAKKEYTNMFGQPFGVLYGDAFKGTIEYDGKSVIERISEMGVCLVLHSNTHLKHATPSGRIFEAAAASAVIISDMNPFVVEHFGDSVLYVNERYSGKKFFEQIDAHMTWIKENPQEALQMAQEAHQIFEENFLLEQQLLDFDKFHQSKKSLKLINGN